jgi:hypothetical protein
MAMAMAMVMVATLWVSAAARERARPEAGSLPDERRLQPAQLEDATPSEQLLRCCWAQGRSAFNYCEEYGACIAGGAGTQCKGRGAADGRVLVCAAEPPAPGAND